MNSVTGRRIGGAVQTGRLWRQINQTIFHMLASRLRENASVKRSRKKLLSFRAKLPQIMGTDAGGDFCKMQHSKLCKKWFELCPYLQLELRVDEDGLVAQLPQSHAADDVLALWDISNALLSSHKLADVGTGYIDSVRPAI